MIRLGDSMARRRNSDALFRGLVRRVAAGENDMIPALAREWERAGGAPLPALDEVARTFENLERNGDHHDAPADILELFRDMESYHECDENAAINRDVGYIDGVADALGMSIEELWAESERARGGAGAERREELERGARAECAQCGEPMVVGDDGVANHLDDDGEIDHDADEDHVPYAAEDQENQEDEVPEQGVHSHVYSVMRCPNCNADLTDDYAVTMTVQPGNGRVLTRLDVDGELQDESDVIARGGHAGSDCTTCGESLNEMEVT